METIASVVRRPGTVKVWAGAVIVFTCAGVSEISMTLKDATFPAIIPLDILFSYRVGKGDCSPSLLIKP